MFLFKNDEKYKCSPMSCKQMRQQQEMKMELLCFAFKTNLQMDSSLIYK